MLKKFRIHGTETNVKFSKQWNMIQAKQQPYNLCPREMDHRNWGEKLIQDIMEENLQKLRWERLTEGW